MRDLEEVNYDFNRQKEEALDLIDKELERITNLRDLVDEYRFDLLHSTSVMHLVDQSNPLNADFLYNNIQEIENLAIEKYKIIQYFSVHDDNPNDPLQIVPDLIEASRVIENLEDLSIVQEDEENLQLEAYVSRINTLKEMWAE